MTRIIIGLLVAVGACAVGLIEWDGPVRGQPGTAKPPGDGGAVPTPANVVKRNGHNFTLPAGFSIESAARTPLVDRPINAAFDDLGRLYVTDSSGSNERPAEQLKNPTHRIMRLEDTDGDGVFDRSTVFADKMMFPEGILWHRGHVYCAAPPHIWRLTDTDDDGKADRRDIWFDGKTVTGCANDLHGPYLGPDGWIYWTKGAFAKQEYVLPDGKKLTTRASHIFRARPDGTGIEPVMTGGMDNPVGLAFLPNGERFFSTTFFQHPGGGKRDGLIHAVYGGIYGKDHDVIYDADHRWTSPHLMPVMTHLGPAAPSGLACYESAGWGAEFRTNLFACQFNLRKISRHVLQPDGATYRTVDSDFVVSDHQDFHPTDVVEDADGSLLVIDTGGWYKLCCPSSQLVKTDVFGGIFRVRKNGSAVDADPRGRKLNWKDPSDKELADRLGDARPAVRLRATEALSARGTDSLSALKELLNGKRPADHRARAVWVLTRIGMPKEELDQISIKLMLSSALLDDSTEVRQAALHAASLLRLKELGTLAADNIVLQAETNKIETRLSAEAAGRLAPPRLVERCAPVLAAFPDRILDHAQTYALIEGGNSAAMRLLTTAERPDLRRAAWIALDQRGEKLDPAALLKEARSPNPLLRETAQWIIGRHAEWGDSLAGHFAEELEKRPDDSLIPQLARFGKSPAVQELLGRTARGGTETSRRIALRAMSAAGLKETPAVWSKSLKAVLETAEGEWLAEAVATVRALPTGKGSAVEHLTSLDRVIGSSAAPAVRFAAMAAVPGGVRKPSDTQVKELRAAIDRDQPPAIRAVAAEVLSRAELTDPQLRELTTKLDRISPLDLDRVLGAYGRSKSEEIGRELITALSAPALRSAVRADQVRERIKHFGPAIQQSAEKLYTLLNADYERQRAKLEELTKSLPAGDVRRGQAVFNSQKAACLACHTIGYVGGKIGPDLTRIGGIRNERDLLEAILFPSAAFVRSYEPLSVNLKDGRQFNGVPKKDAPDEIILVIAADKEVRIDRSQIDEVHPGKVSIMPAGLDQQITLQELADLIAFLRGCR